MSDKVSDKVSCLIKCQIKLSDKVTFSDKVKERAYFGALSGIPTESARPDSKVRYLHSSVFSHLGDPEIPDNVPI